MCRPSKLRDLSLGVQPLLDLWFVDVYGLARVIMMIFNTQHQNATTHNHMIFADPCFSKPS